MSNEPIADPDEPHGTQILWGRVLVLLLALALSFWLGTTFGGDDGAQRQLAEQRDEITRLEAQVASLQAELAAVDAGGEESEAAGDAASEVSAAQTSRREEPTEQAERDRQPQDDGSSYVIQSGDSLAAIAQDVYGDPTKWRDIARANDLQEPYSLTVGESLRIPEVP